jgi:hypothetical protein
MESSALGVQVHTHTSDASKNGDNSARAALSIGPESLTELGQHGSDILRSKLVLI